MHTGGANTVLKNNRKLLKKRTDRYRSKRTVMGLRDSDIKRKDDKNRRLTTMSASEIRKIGRKYRIRNRVEMIIVLSLILGVLIWMLFSLSGSNPIILTKSDPETITSLKMKLINKADYIGDNGKVYIADPIAEDYIDFGRYLYMGGEYKRAEKMFVKALTLDQDNCQAETWLGETHEALKQKQGLKSEWTMKKQGNRYLYLVE